MNADIAQYTQHSKDTPVTTKKQLIASNYFWYVTDNTYEWPAITDERIIIL